MNEFLKKKLSDKQAEIMYDTLDLTISGMSDKELLAISHRLHAMRSDMEKVAGNPTGQSHNIMRMEVLCNRELVLKRWKDSDGVPPVVNDKP